MNRVPSFVFCVAVAAMILFSGVSRLQAQAQTPSPTPAAQTPAPTPSAQDADRGRTESVCSGARSARCRRA